ncbi:MAG: epoxide hydrolase family protein [Dermatophilaceae bacterium]
MPTIRSHDIAVPEADLDDLRARLAAARLPDAETVQDDSQGVTLGEVQTLLDHWRSAYDWRRTETEINALGSSWAQLEPDLGVHFLHIRSPHDDALPLLLCHGWPGSVLEFKHLVEPLTDPTRHGGSPTDAFHLVIPSMPGFGFSDKPREAGWDIDRIARSWIRLMGELGYADRWAAQGGDWGSAVVESVSRARPPGLVGVHSTLPMAFPTPEEREQADDDERAMLADADRYVAELSGYSTLQSTRPQAVGFALADSPVGQAAWILQLFKDVSDSGGRPLEHFSLDEIIDDVMLYWLPNAGASSGRLYWEAARAERPQGTAPPNDVPTGFSIFPGEAVRASRRWVERRYSQVVHYDRASRGGHFAAMENPAELVDGIRATFTSLR